MSSIKDKAIKGIAWNVIEKLGNQTITFLLGIVLARLLSPNDYGMIGILMIFTSIAQILSEGGFTSALIVKSNVTVNDYNTSFWFNVVVSVVCFILVFLLAPVISTFYQLPELDLLAKIISLNIIINAFGNIHKAKLQKELNFKYLAKINLFSNLISGLIGIIAAYNSYGVWALVVQTLSKNIISNSLYWFGSNWLPLLNFSKESFKSLFKFGSNMLTSNLINSFSENFISLMIGKLFNPLQLGYYTRANQFQKFPVTLLSSISSVGFPLLSQIQEDNVKIKMYYKKIIKLVAFLIFPVMGLIGVSAEYIIEILLTEKWLPSVPILQLLCVTGALYPIHVINLDLIKIKNRSDLFLRIEIIVQILTITTVFISFKYGIMGLMYGLLILDIICLFIHAFYTKVFIDYGMFRQLKDIMKYLISSLILVGIVYTINHFNFNNYIKLTVIPPLCFMLYLFFHHKLDSLEMHELKIVFNRLKNKLA